MLFPLAIQEDARIAYTMRRARFDTKRLTFTGCLAAPDEHGRIRIHLMDLYANGAPDHSWQMLEREFGWREDNTPVTIHQHVSGDGTHGTVVLATPADRRQYWLGVAEGLRGQRVRVEATVREYLIPGKLRGVALDLAWLEADQKMA